MLMAVSRKVAEARVIICMQTTEPLPATENVFF